MALQLSKFRPIRSVLKEMSWRASPAASILNLQPNPTTEQHLITLPLSPPAFPLFSSVAESSKMRPVTASTSSALRSWTRHTLPTSATSSTSRFAAVSAAGTASPSSSQRRLQSSDSGASSFESPFQHAKYDTTKIPSFKNYASKGSEVSNRVFSYFLAGSMGLLAAAGAKATVQGM